MPGRRPSSSTASRVTIATTRAGPVDDDLDLREQPVDLELGDGPREPVARAEARAVRLAAQPLDLGGGTIRRLPRVALVSIRPSRSQRRSVSRLIPSALAASPAL